METYDTQALKQKILSWGADLVGVADPELLKAIPTQPRNLLKPYRHAVSIGVSLPVAAFEMIVDQPTPIYNAIYQTANRLLDDIAFKTASTLQQDGYLSLPVPASQIIDRENLCGAISHKAVARIAGIGWQGKNLLLITPRFGSRVRLVTVLTDAPLDADGPIKNRCGKCTSCQDACPAEAIRGINTEDHYQSRNEALHFQRCADKLMQEFAALPGVEAPICGICIKVCPFGRKKKRNLG
jgi:epoxyqueuosine reductase QueG